MDPSTTGPNKEISLWWVVPILFLTLLLHLTAIDWGLPSSSRMALSYQDMAQVERLLQNVSTEEVTNSWQHWTYLHEESKGNEIPMWVFNPIRSYHADEYLVLKSISNMKPASFDFNPHFFVWGTLYFYLVATGLKLFQLTGLLEITPNLLFYFQHPEMFARFYLVGRIISLCCTLGAVGITAWLGRLLGSNATAIIAALFAAMAPLSIGYGHFMTTDPLLACCFAAAVALPLWALTRRTLTWRHYAWCGAAIGLAASAKYNGAISCVSLILVHLWYCFKNKELGALHKHLRLVVAGLVAIVVFVAVTPYAVLSFDEFRHDLSAVVHITAGPESAQSGNWDFFSQALCNGTHPVIVMLSLVGIWSAVRHRSAPGIIISIIAVSYFSFFAASSLAEDRMLLPLVPLVAVLAAFALQPGSGRNDWGPVIGRAYAPLLLLVFIILFANTLMIMAAVTGPDVRMQAGAWLTQHVEPGTRLGLFGQMLQPYQPPLNYEDYDIIKGNGELDDFSRMGDAAPDYIVINGEYLRREHDRKLQQLDRHHAYQPVQTFGQWPVGRGLATGFDNLVPLRTYIAPRFIILKKITY